jgi:hypothetical protein
VRLVGLYHPQWVEAMVFHLNVRFDKMFKEALTERLDDFWNDHDRMPNADNAGFTYNGDA